MNPTTRFARPDQPISPSPSRSPARRQQFISHELDPLLANLSPSSTLEALQSTSAVSAEVGTHKRALLDSVAVVSTLDRAWGIKAALAGKKVREWYKELVAWPWPTASEGSGNGFEPFLAVGREADPARDVSADRDAGIDSRKKTEFWGHLPAHLVQECEDRIEAIRDDMETLEIEELKEHVRVTHHLPSRGPSVYDHHESNDVTVHGHGHMDDFTAIVTATIMQTLPHLARLHSLLSTWSVRLSVLRQVPGFLDCLEKAQTALEAAWEVVKPLKMEALGHATRVDRNTFYTIRNVLEKRVSELGQRLDCMLDALEGREDTLPEHWIDTMEALETDFGTWVVETERQVLDNELRSGNSRNKLRPSAGDSETPSQSYIAAKDEHDSLIKPSSEVASDKEMYENGREDNAVNPYRPSEHTRIEDGTQDDEILHSRDLSESRLEEVSQGIPLNSYQLQSDGIGELSSKLESVVVSQSRLSAESQPSYFPKFSTETQRLEGSDHGSFKAYAPEAIRKSSDVDIGVVTRGRTVSRPTPLTLKQPRDSMTSNAASEFSSDVSFPGSSTSDYFSDMSSPEIQQASRAEYFGAPIEVTTPSLSQRDPISPTDTISRQSSQRTERGSRRSLSMDFLSGGIISPTSQRSRASSFIPESTIPENGGLNDPWLINGNSSICHQRGRSASMQSFSIIPRNEVSHFRCQELHHTHKYPGPERYN